MPRAMRIVAAPIHAIQERPDFGCGVSGDSMCKVSGMESAHRMMLAGMRGVKRRRASRARQQRSLFNLPADHEAVNQRLGKVRGTHAFLDRRNVVGNAPEFHGLVFEVGDCKTGARVAVTRLADRAWI